MKLQFLKKKKKMKKKKQNKIEQKIKILMFHKKIIFLVMMKV